MFFTCSTTLVLSSFSRAFTSFTGASMVVVVVVSGSTEVVVVVVVVVAAVFSVVFGASIRVVAVTGC